MQVQTFLTFPTVISQSKHHVSKEEKDAWFNLYLKHSNQRGQSHDCMGYERVHTDESFPSIFMDRLRGGVKEYLKSLSINPSKLDVQLTKCFFNVTDKNAINPHDHMENHISFTYYPHVARGKERSIVFHNEIHGNEPYQHFFMNHCKEWTQNNCINEGFPISEGVMYVFPSKMKHDIEVKRGDGKSEVKGFRDVASLNNSRFCVAGDLLFTRKEGVEEYSRVLSSPKNWTTI